MQNKIQIRKKTKGLILTVILKKHTFQTANVSLMPFIDFCLERWKESINRGSRKTKEWLGFDYITPCFLSLLKSINPKFPQNQCHQT